jgi:hypothetical protein
MCTVDIAKQLEVRQPALRAGTLIIYQNRRKSECSALIICKQCRRLIGRELLYSRSDFVIPPHSGSNLVITLVIANLGSTSWNVIIITKWSENLQYFVTDPLNTLHSCYTQRYVVPESLFHLYE